jgi:hypothetical protein
LKVIKDWAGFDSVLKKEFQGREWGSENQHKQWVASFDKVFPRLKKKVSTNFSVGAQQYLKALAIGIQGAWNSRLRDDLANKAFPSLSKFNALLEEREKDMVLSKEKWRKKDAEQTEKEWKSDSKA